MSLCTLLAKSRDAPPKSVILKYVDIADSFTRGTIVSPFLFSSMLGFCNVHSMRWKKCLSSGTSWLTIRWGIAAVMPENPQLIGDFPWCDKMQCFHAASILIDQLTNCGLVAFFHPASSTFNIFESQVPNCDLVGGSSLTAIQGSLRSENTGIYSMQSMIWPSRLTSTPSGPALRRAASFYLATWRPCPLAASHFAYLQYHDRLQFDYTANYRW